MPKKIFAGLLLIAAAAIYLPALSSPFLVDDDSCITVKSGYYAKGLPELLRHFLTHPKDTDVASRPVTVVTLWLNYKMGGVSPAVYKATNILLHAGLAFLIFFLMQYLCKRHAPRVRWIVPWGAALLFFCHPAHLSAVNNVVRRSIILMGILGLTGLYGFLKFCHEGHRRYYALALVCLPLSLLAKAPGIAFIAVVLLYIGLFAEPQKKFRLWLSCLPMLVLSAAILAFLYFGQYNPQFPEMDRIHYPLYEARVIWLYWKLFFWPWLVPFIFNAMPDTSVFQLVTWLAIIGHIAVIVLAARLTRNVKYKLCGFAILCAYIMVLPESGLFPMTVAIEGYRTYVPFLFLSVAFVAFMAEKLQGRYWLSVLLTGVCLAFGSVTWLRNTQINTYGKWHYVMVSYSQKNDIMNMVALELLSREGEQRRVNDLLALLVKNRPDVTAYAFIQKLALIGPGQSLEENIAMIESRPRIQLPMFLLPFFINTLDHIVLARYPESQKDLIRHRIFFSYIFTLLKNDSGYIDIRWRYRDVLLRLERSYGNGDPASPQEEWDREKVRAAITVLNNPPDGPVKKYIDQMFKDHPNWQAFWPAP